MAEYAVCSRPGVSIHRIRWLSGDRTGAANYASLIPRSMATFKYRTVVDLGGQGEARCARSNIVSSRVYTGTWNAEMIVFSMAGLGRDGMQGLLSRLVSLTTSRWRTQSQQVSLQVSRLASKNLRHLQAKKSLAGDEEDVC
jgi:hypothetical protein